MSGDDALVIDRGGVDALLAALTREGYTLLGPKVADGAIVYDELHDSSDLPVGLDRRAGAGALPTAPPR